MLSSPLLALALAVGSAWAATAPTFAPPAPAYNQQSPNYIGKNNNTITNGPLVSGRSFDRFINIWLENTDYATAASSSVFQSLIAQGVLMDNFYGVTHPSEPNYIAVAGGDFFGDASDNFRHIPSNISTIVDLLEAKNISWSSYQENMPYAGYTPYNYTQANYLTPGSNYTYYVRKHNPLIIYDSVANVTERALRIRNFNDFAADLNASAISQWTFITPNLVNDGHDTDINFMSAWLTYFLVPLLNNTAFNDGRTLILLTFDENETYTINNQVFTLALGGSIPAALRGTTDHTFYTHYSTLSTVQANWALGSLGRQDTNKTLNNVFTWVAEAAGWTNNGLTGNTSIPLMNATATIPGPLNPVLYVPFTAPNTSAVGAGGGPVFIASGLNTAFTAASAPAPINLTAQGQSDVPWAVDPGFDYPTGNKTFAAPATSSTAPGGTSAAVGGLRVGVESVVVLVGVVVGAVMLL
ncbi:hypothetical protein JAAARDRAFT_159425 [Jaapia argillacea MUCL 33604]|uniref:Acid phosphatase n=1 Tax=Jaapia argillacea MUCL 33604 TaxID=933084 RepID=A0A067PW07_9AGAM|nr:hypothetical protein JAAARDRAFT_159425 [Jaapia argillacea MUCL 33604]